MADNRKLEKVPRLPGVYRRHAVACKDPKRCACPYIVRWRDHNGVGRKQVFATRKEAAEFRGSLASGKTSRRPLTSDTVRSYYKRWFETYRGRTRRGLEQTTRSEYETSFRLHILPLSIGTMKLRAVGSRDVRDWLADLERRDCSPTTIRKAKAALGVMMATAAQDGDIGANPVTGVRYVPSDAAKEAHSTRKRKDLTAEDVTAILAAMPEQWQAFFTLLAQSGVRIGELLGLTWQNVHLGDDAHIMVEEQIYDGKRKKLKTDASKGRVPLSPTMAAWLTELRPEDPAPDAPVFPSTVGTPLHYHNVYNRVLHPALQASGIAVQVGEDEHGQAVWDYQGVAFHAFRKACGSLLFAHGKTLKQVQGFLRHAQLTTTMNVYINQVDDGLGGAEIWDEIMPAVGPRLGHGATDGANKSGEVPAKVTNPD